VIIYVRISVSHLLEIHPPWATAPYLPRALMYDTREKNCIPHQTERKDVGYTLSYTRERETGRRCDHVTFLRSKHTEVNQGQIVCGVLSVGMGGGNRPENKRAEKKVEGMHKDKEIKRLVKGPSWRRRCFSCLSREKGEVTGVRRRWWW